MHSTAAGALRLAAARGDIQTLEILSRLPTFNVDADMAGFTPLMAAVNNCQEQAVLWLLQHGASLTTQKEDGWHDTVLHYAAAKGNMPIIHLLLAAGADPCALNANGRSAGEVAQANKNRTVADYISIIAAGKAPLPGQARPGGGSPGWQHTVPLKSSGTAGQPGQPGDIASKLKASGLLAAGGYQLSLPSAREVGAWSAARLLARAWLAARLLLAVWLYDTMLPAATATCHSSLLAIATAQNRQALGMCSFPRSLLQPAGAADRCTVSRALRQLPEAARLQCIFITPPHLLARLSSPRPSFLCIAAAASDREGLQAGL
jgi:hypothetical protein